jgi:hypothetical protein
MPSNNYIYKMSNAGGMSTITRYTDMLAGNATFIEPAYESISTVTVGAGGASTVTFSSIPSTYQHLQIRVFVQTNRGTFCRDNLKVIFNADSGANYADHEIYGDGASVGAGATTSATSMSIGTVGTSAVLSSLLFGGRIIDVIDYANASKYKTVRSIGGVDMNGTGVSGIGGLVDFKSGLWQSSTAINSMTFTTGVGTSFNQYSSFALYGIKG